ncbi:hypothetical protein PQ465_20360 [Sphingobacterium oryzagri]|uniref:Beta/gamma crystallin 'Greek key' domain-containing protein n=1 Tax=Sphingobacterium oryzagri TaxID=3025669 RepID=A0ABY7WK15_9SPHI|nr:hypothetical protein [Sphingobacterium sp. KACC 22765]WDF68635.1 hypothetical protein PQ465_20360 [Sphingobacterium sp. KACC 22765]
MKKYINYSKAYLLVCSAFFALATACSDPNFKEVAPSDLSTADVNQTLIDTSLANLTFVSNPVNLNIVMFVPNDNPARSDYRPRLSQLFVHFQQWFHDEMARYGYNDYLGLPKADSSRLVNIIEIPAAGGQADYPYSSSVSASKIVNEVNAYRAAHPEKFSSNRHYLILLPERTVGTTGQPFYGWGRYCFAVDNQFMSVNHIPHPNNSNLLGGMLHELGHGLNLAHNHAKYQSEAPTLGTSLMGSGNVSFSRGQPTFLTQVDAAILHRNEVFQANGPASNIYSAATQTVSPRFQINNSTQQLQIGGTYTSNLPVSDILVYMDPNVNNEGVGVNKDYNAVAWRFPVNTANQISGTIDLRELNFKGNTPYELRLKLLFENGTIANNSYAFNYKNDLLTTNLDTLFTFADASYNGIKGSFGIGKYTTADLISRGVANNSISSLQIGTEIRAVLYNGDNFTGDSLVVTANSTYLSSFNDKTSSIKIEAK